MDKRKDLDESRNKELIRLEKLIDESRKQKRRCIKIFEDDVRKIGVVEFSKRIGCSSVYIYDLIKKGMVSPDKLRELWEQAFFYVDTFKLDR